jgi:hypothetical protein
MSCNLCDETRWRETGWGWWILLFAPSFSPSGFCALFLPLAFYLLVSMGYEQNTWH